MHGTLPPLPCTITDPRAFENLAVMKCPVYADVLCPICKGHGAYNTMLNFAGPMRHQFTECVNCNGDGWIERDGEHHRHDIITITDKDGRRYPQWVTIACDSSGFAIKPKR